MFRTETNKGKILHFLLFIFPLLCLAGLFVYFATPLAGIKTASDPINPFARQGNTIIISMRVVFGFSWLALAAISAALFAYRTKRLLSGVIDYPSEILCFVFMLSGLSLIYWNEYVNSPETTHRQFIRQTN